MVLNGYHKRLKSARQQLRQMELKHADVDKHLRHFSLKSARHQHQNQLTFDNRQHRRNHRHNHRNRHKSLRRQHHMRMAFKIADLEKGTRQMSQRRQLNGADV